MIAPIVETWWTRLAARHEPSAFAALARGYGDPARGYHDWTHIEDLLGKLDQLTHLATRVDLIAAAIFWHDSVFVTDMGAGRARPDADNVRDSAALFRAHSRFDAVGSRAIEEMILATAGHLTAVAPDDPPYAEFPRDLALFLDLDLSSLGAPWEVFWRNFGRIRAEYPFIAERDFLQSRQAGLRSFAAGGATLFRLEETRELWLPAALENCRRADETIGGLLAKS